MFDLDSDEFDSYSEGSNSLALLSAMQQLAHTADSDAPSLALVTALAASPAEDLESQDSLWKGKGVSRPMPIPLAPPADPHDLFDIGEASSSQADRDYYSFSPPFSPSSSVTCASLTDEPGSAQASSWKGKAASMQDPRDIFDMSEAASSHAFPSFSSRFSPVCASPIDSIEQLSTSIGHEDLSESICTGKGKEREQPPTLPPLTFSPTGFDYVPTNWPSPPNSAVAGPSSYDSRATPRPSSYSSLAPLDLISVPAPPPPVLSTPPTVPRLLSRRRSLPSLAGAPGTKYKFRPSNLARKLLFRKYDGDSSACPTPPSSPTDGRDLDLGVGTCFAPWRNDSALALEYQYQQPSLKGRTHSSPFPICALDLVPAATAADIFEPIPLFVPNYFDDVLPRELQVHVMLALIAVHEGDHARAVRDGLWTVAKASSSRNKWVGRDKALRELVRFSRVSKSWQALVFDGQIWANLDLRAFPLLPKSLLLRIARTAGSFVKDINVAGHVNLHSGTLIEVTDSLSALAVSTGCFPFTHLTGINLRGCSAITTRSLHPLLQQSCALERLCLKGLAAVTNTTCAIIGDCARLLALDLGRCPNIDAAGVRSLAAKAALRKEDLPLKELRLSGLKYVDDNMMAALGRAAPYLEVLDLSYVRQLHNTAVEAFVACDEEDEDVENGFRIVRLNAREAGRSIDESNKYWRRVTRLRHLSLSSCLLLTDATCSHLAHSVPALEYLELAGIGSSLRDEGIIRLLNTTPRLKRLDLEDASSITDSVLATLTPAPPDETEDADPAPESPLEHLIISGALEVSDDALLALIRGCARLTVLEADNTRMGPVVLKTFIRTARRRALQDPKIVAIDCRGFGEVLLKDLAVHTRPRLGWRAHGARGLGFLDARDGAAEDLKVGQDECDPARVVVKTFYGWQTVDAVQAGREKRRKAKTRRAANESAGSSDVDDSVGRGTRWWSPGGRRSGTNSPPVVPENEGCTIM
ncbi:RNI-like protein [Mycena vitilis]|nr:RNI-like protein [Mycena vitilis]